MKQLLGLTLFLALVINFSIGQTDYSKDTSLVFKINYNIQSFDDENDYRILLNSLNGFLKTKNQCDTSNAYWVQSEFKKYKYPYGDLFGIEYSRKYKSSNFYKPTLLQIINTEITNQYILKLAYTGPDTLKESTIRAIYNIIAVKQSDGSYQFKSMLVENTACWNRTTIGTITYIYKDNLNRELAEQANQLNIEIAKKFNVTPISIVYYKCKNPIELARIKGYDYWPWMYIDTTGGRAEGGNTIFAANNSEWFPHEFVHFYTPEVGMGLLRQIIDEGCATYLGGTVGKSVEEILKTTNYFYKKYPERDILYDLENNYRINGKMEVLYPVGGLICKLIDEKLGFEGFKQIYYETDFYKAIERVLGVKKENLADFLKNELARYK
ncbi:MAG: hypothetical protein HY964_10195 [Ignavibacteriales bacterium]|nr:hypothetical protein [Ignavibacteriales bacterium]